MIKINAICRVCPNACALDEGEKGICRARTNNSGAVVPLTYGAVSSLALDPIEKKPLRHYYAGSKILSVGGYGCNMRCFFCQNHAISQSYPSDNNVVTPEELVLKAEEFVPHGNIGLAFTYNEPGVAFEFVRDTSLLARDKGLLNVMVTNGYMTKYALGVLLGSIDAFNIDLKCFTKMGYKKLGGDLDDVCSSIILASERAHVEITTLVVPGLSDDEDDMKKEAEFLASLPKVPALHISRYFPRYKSTIPATPAEKMRRLYDIAKERLEHVYLGNI